MANITRFDPFGIGRFDPFGESFDDVFRRFFKPMRWEGEGGPLEIRLDVEEGEQAYTVKAEIPGVKKEDISVQVEGNTVSISAESKREEEVKEKGKLLRSERYYGSLYRSFTLGQDIDRDAASAKYEDGVLTLTLPKRAGAAATKVTVA